MVCLFWIEPLGEITYSAISQKGIKTRFEYWGLDVDHDWPWWYKMVDTYVPWMLGI